MERLHFRNNRARRDPKCGVGASEWDFQDEEKDWDLVMKSWAARPGGTAQGVVGPAEGHQVYQVLSLSSPLSGSLCKRKYSHNFPLMLPKVSPPK